MKNDLPDYMPYIWNPAVTKHGIHMIAVDMFNNVAPILGQKRVRPLLDFALNRIFNFFIKLEHKTLFEVLNVDGSFITEREGRLINPGHILESMWFCIEAADKIGE